MDMSETLIALLSDPVTLSLIKGQIVEPTVKGLAAKGLIDEQDVGTCVEAAEIFISKTIPRTMAAGKSA